MGCGASAPADVVTTAPPKPPSAAPAPPAPPPAVSLKTAKGLSSKPEPTPEAAWKALHSAIRWEKDSDTILAMLTPAPALINSVDPNNGNRPLHIASQNGFMRLVKLCLDKGADIDAQNGTGQTALHMAVAYDYDEVAELLILKGANALLKNETGHAAQHGINGDRDPNGPKGLKQFRMADSEASFLEAMQQIAAEQGHKKEDVVKVGLGLKKSFKPEWTGRVAVAFGELVGSIKD